METHDVNLERTFTSKKFLGLLLIAVLITYAVPFPLATGFLKGYGKMKEIKREMERENEAIVCHTVYNTNPEFFGSQGMKCSEEHYRPNETPVGCCGMSVYRDTYWEYLRIKKNLTEELPEFILFVVWVFLSLLTFSYALIEGAVCISEGREVSLKGSILTGLRALPALIASEFVMFVALIVALILLAIPIAILGPIGGILAVILTAPAFALVIPAYYFTRKVGPVVEVWNTLKNNTGGYIVLGLLLGLLDTAMMVQYDYYFGVWTLLIMLAVGMPRYVLNSVGALVVYLDGAETPEGEEKRGIEWEV